MDLENIRLSEVGQSKKIIHLYTEQSNFYRQKEWWFPGDGGLLFSGYKVLVLQNEKKKKNNTLWRLVAQ